MSRKDDLKASEQFSKGSALRHKEHQYDLEAAQEVAEAEVTPRPPDDERAGQILCKCGHAKVQHHVSGSGWGDCYTPDCPCRFYVRVPAEPPAREPLAEKVKASLHVMADGTVALWKKDLDALIDELASLRAQLAQAETEAKEKLWFEQRVKWFQSHAIAFIEDGAITNWKETAEEAVRQQKFLEAALAQAQEKIRILEKK